MASIRCGSSILPESMRLIAHLDWTTGRLLFARLDVADRTYGGRSEWSGDAKEFVYIFRPATPDPKTNGLDYAADAAVVAAATLGSDGTRLGLRSGVVDANELRLASRIVVGIAQIGFGNFDPHATCSIMPVTPE